ncbi:MAG: iron-containing alcohol dehydrogenase [Deltaproteobacteria bacterium]|nr:iron-containing alcohol dehydrogenase [Deltaproteobacteria bacterium]
MDNFTYHNPVKIVFGKGSISELKSLIKRDHKVMITYGGGSIKKNGVYDQVMETLKGRELVEFGGIEPNPEFETLMKGVEAAKKEKIDFLLAVGGGSVLDGAKFMAAAIFYKRKDPWEIVSRGFPLTAAVPVGAVMTLPATGSEMNGYAVISRRARGEKRAFGSPLSYPRFSILDPETTFSLPDRQVSNGIVDTFVHTTEQYLTVREGSPLQDRQAEAILKTLIEEAPKVRKSPHDYSVRANLMWCATQALNGLIGCGVPQDWATHMIGHELTAMHGLDHGQALAIVLPALLKYEKANKLEKLVQFGERIWNISEGSSEEKADKAIDKTVAFFHSLGVKTTLKDYNIGPDGFEKTGSTFDERNMALGEKGNIKSKEVVDILKLCLG